jgi:MerR family transcriptional regulator, light-induced transcriptional regulator
MASYSIKDLEKLSGIKAHTIRIWEKRYGLVEPKRTETNIRFYDDEDLKKILNTALLNRNGVKISQIAQLDKKEISIKVSALAGNFRANENIIDNLVIAMIELDEYKFEKILSNTIIQKGFEESILNAIYPFFEKIGILWQTGAINPAQEHFMSNLIRQKLIVAIDGIAHKDIPNSKRFVLFLPEAELHEIGLLFYYYLIKKRGHQVVYLGQSVPFNDIISVTQTKKCDYLFTSFSSTITGIDIVEYLKNLSSSFPEQNILFSSYDMEGVDAIKSKNMFRIKNAIDFVQFIDKI